MATFYVDQNGGIEDAVAIARAGDVIQVSRRSRPYTDNLRVTHSGTSGSPIRIESDNYAEITPSDAWRFDADWWELYGLRFTEFDRLAPLRLGYDSRVDHMLIDSCSFMHGAKPAFAIYNLRDSVITGCTFRDIRSRVTGNDKNAINFLRAANTVTISDCTFEDIGSDGIQFLPNGPQGFSVSQITVEDCTFFVNRPYSTESWQDFSYNVGENGIDVKWVDGPIYILSCEFTGFHATVSGQDCGGDLRGPAIRIHDGAEDVYVQDCIMQDCTTGVRVRRGAAFTGPVYITRLYVTDDVITPLSIQDSGTLVILDDAPLDYAGDPPEEEDITYDVEVTSAELSIADSILSLNIPVIAREDDAEETWGGLIHIRSYDLDSYNRQAIGMRFQDVTIPNGATIVSAIVRLTSTRTLTGVARSQTLYCEDADDAAAFSETTNDISDRMLTTASVAWTPGAVSEDVSYDTNDITACVQEVIDRAGWVSGNALVVITNNGLTGENRSAYSYDSTGEVPQLRLTYLDPAPPTGHDYTVTIGDDFEMTILEDIT